MRHHDSGRRGTAVYVGHGQVVGATGQVVNAERIHEDAVSGTGSTSVIPVIRVIRIATGHLDNEFTIVHAASRR